ncbi:MAG: hypothetical protein DBX55_03085 [Verrucomicrobia bacterium]|nr:MAG: hypothetical protein DBX55_03085 [Verrucomicrobiota bacterium]
MRAADSAPAFSCALCRMRCVGKRTRCVGNGMRRAGKILAAWKIWRANGLCALSFLRRLRMRDCGGGAF